MTDNTRALVFFVATLGSIAVFADGDDERTARHLETVQWQQVYRTQDTQGAFFAVSVSNIDESIAWYTEKLGFALDHKSENEVRKGALLSRPGVLLELAEFDGAVDLASLDLGRESHEIFGVFKIGLLTPSAEATQARLAEAGVETVFGIVTASDGRQTFGVSDPDGNLVQFFSRPPGAVDLRPYLLAVSVPNIEESIAWYCDVLGFEMDTHDKYPDDKIEVALLRYRDYRLELVEHDLAVAPDYPDPDNPATVYGFGKLAFYSADPAGIARRAKATDTTFVYPPSDCEQNIDCSFTMKDPSGNWIQVFRQH